MDKKDGDNRHYFSRLTSSFAGLLRVRDIINLSNIRAKNLKYMLIFALAPIFANMQGAMFISDIRMFGIDAMTLMGSAYCVGAGVIFAFTSVKSMAFIARTSTIITLAGFIPWLLLPDSQISLSLAMLFTLGFGCCAACAAFAYTFALNNTERFFGAAIISLFCMLMEFDYGLSFISGLFDKTYLTILVIGTVICLWQYKTEEFTDALKQPESKLNPALKLVLYFFVAHKLVEIFYTYFPVASTSKALVINGLVGIAVIILSFALQALAKRSIWNMCNLFFIAMICAYALYFTPEGSVGREFSRIFHGFEQMGYIASYYLLGCVFKKHGNFRLFKRSLVIILPGCLLLYIIPGALAAFAPEYMALVATLTTGTIFIAFFLMSPFFSKHLFFADWSDEFHLADMAEAQRYVEQTDCLANLNLTPIEKEIAALLLQGMAIKKIAVILKMKYDSVKYQVKKLYKKSGVESRAELLICFGLESKTYDGDSLDADHSGADNSGTGHSGTDHSGTDHSGADHSGADHSEQGVEEKHINKPDGELSVPELPYNDLKHNIETLTVSEREIFNLHLRGFTAQQIADERRCSLRTVKFHNTNIYAKLGIGSHNELMLLIKMICGNNDESTLV